MGAQRVGDVGERLLVVDPPLADLVARQLQVYAQLLEVVPPATPGVTVGQRRAVAGQQPQMLGQLPAQLLAGSSCHERAAGLDQPVDHRSSQMPQRRHEPGHVRIEVSVDGLADAGAGVSDHEIGVVAQLVEQQPPRQMVGLGHRPHQPQPRHRPHHREPILQRVAITPSDLGGDQDEEPVVAAGTLLAVGTPVDRHVVEQHHLRTLQRLACLPQRIQPRPLSQRRGTQPTVDRLVDDRGERLNPVGSDVPRVVRRGAARVLHLLLRSRRLPVAISAGGRYGCGRRCHLRFAAHLPQRPQRRISVRAAARQVRQPTSDQTHRPTVPTRHRGLAVMHATQLVALVALVALLMSGVHVVARQRRREPMRLPTVRRGAPVALPTLDRPRAIHPITHNVPTRMLRARRGRFPGGSGLARWSDQHREVVLITIHRAAAKPPLHARGRRSRPT